MDEDRLVGRPSRRCASNAVRLLTPRPFARVAVSHARRADARLRRQVRSTA
jgi:hypothetical protein